MWKKTATLLSLVIVIAVLAIATPPSAAGHDGSYSKSDQATKSLKRNAPKARGKARRKVRKVVSYSCPMHPDMLSPSPGECPKCGMDLHLDHDLPITTPQGS